MNVDLAPHSQLAAACRASCPARGDCRECPIARLCVTFTGDAPLPMLVTRSETPGAIRPLVRVENLTAPERAA